METVFQELRFAVRVWLRDPRFTVVAVITLMLGIGANSIIFTILSSVVLRPLPYPDADRLVQIWESNPRQQINKDTVSPHNFMDWREQSKSFEQLTASRYSAFNLTGDYEPERLVGASVSSGFFTVLGVTPVLGRNFLAEEDTAGKNRVAILSHGLWSRRFGSDPGLIGRTLTLNGESYTVIGIMPPDFQFPVSVELWTPMAIDLNRVERGNHILNVIGRLRPDVTLQSAQAEMNAIAQGLEQQFPDTNAGRGVNLIKLHEEVVGNVTIIFSVLFGAVALLLLIACVNIANLLLARATARQKETAVKLALGASRLRLIRQSMLETLLLAMLGGGLGLLLAYWGTDVLVSLFEVHLPRANEIQVNGQVLTFTFTVSLLVGVLLGLAPVLGVINPDINEALKESGRGATGRRQRLRSVLVVSEFILALVLLNGAGLLLNSLYRLQQVNPGFTRENAVTMQISLPRSRYAEGQQQIEFFRQLLERIVSTPGVQYAGAVSDLPFSQSRTSGSFEIEGRPMVKPGESLIADSRIATPDYFRSMGIQILKGRDFAATDGKQSPGVAIINQTMARRYWSDESPIGKRLIIGSPEERALYGGPIWREIVGVVGDVKHDTLDAEAAPEIYVPYLQSPIPRMSLVVRAVGDPGSLIPAIRSAMQSIDPQQPLYNVSTMEERVWQSVSTRWMITLLLVAFAAVALILAAIGIYGVISYSIIQRTQEIGIRMALGAQTGDVLKLIVGQGMVLTLTGVGLGTVAALALNRFISSLVFGISTTDLTTLASVSVLLVAVAFIACYVPARRATHISPMMALKYE